ncbi:hypothetical protein PHYBLDRAFT_99255, partial [Phycomyces blakesleeanus NRRL 1555(-)]
IGLGVSVITNLIQAFSMAYQRKSHILNDLFPKELRISAYKRPLWVAAFGSYMVANIIGSVFSIGYLPIVILAPIGAMNLVFNTVAARLVLGDPLTQRSILGTMLIVTGALLVGFFGIINEPNHSLDDLILLYKRPTFIIYFGILESGLLLMMLITQYLDYRYGSLDLDEWPPSKRLLGIRSLGLVDLKTYIGMSNNINVNINIHTYFSRAKQERVNFLYGILGGCVSSQSLLFAKSGVELIILTVVYKENQLQYALTWILLAMMVITAILQLFYLNKGLRLCDTVMLVPLSFCAFNVSTLFNGLVYYDQWDRLQWWQLVCVLVGVSLTVVGVVFLS